MRAVDVMSSPVISIRPEASVQEAAAVLAANRISGAPVMDECGLLLGMVSEADLLRRIELGTEANGQGRPSSEAHANRDAEDYVKSHGRLAINVMTEEVVSVEDTAPLADVARLMEHYRVGRLPVIRAGRIVGVVSRADLVAALAVSAPEPGPAGALDDAEIRSRLVAQLKCHDWAFDEHQIDVRDGIVHLWNGRAQPHSEIHAMVVMAERLPGVKEVEVHNDAAPTQPV